MDSRLLVAALVASVAFVACGGASTPTSPSVSSAPDGAAAASATGTPAPSTSGTAAPDGGGSSSPAANQCETYGGRRVTVGRTTAAGAFTSAPFQAGDLSLITNGNETNDARFSYQWIRNRGASVNIYAPADGVLIRLRHKTRNAEFASDDFDLFFLVACTPGHGDRDTLVRFNHITDPRADFVAAYAGGSQPSQDLSVSPPIEFEQLQVPATNISVRAGELLGSTRGTPTANDFDFMISVDDRTVCPFSVLEEPHRSALLGLFGPKSASPAGPPVAGYPCQGYGDRP